MMKFWTWKSSQSPSKLSVWFQGFLKELEIIGRIGGRDWRAKKLELWTRAKAVEMGFERHSKEKKITDLSPLQT